jgi:hypothetical protein
MSHSRGAVPRGVTAVALLMSAAAAGMFVSLSVLGDHGGARFESILPAVPALAPLVVILYCVWGYYPPVRSMAPAILSPVL